MLLLHVERKGMSSVGSDPKLPLHRPEARQVGYGRPSGRINTGHCRYEFSYASGESRSIADDDFKNPSFAGPQNLHHLTI